MSYKLTNLVLIEVVGWVKAVIPTLTVTTSDNIWTGDKNNRNELERCVDCFDLIIGDLVFELSQTSVVAKRF